MDTNEFFRKLRFDAYHHLGLGDIRLTIGQQEEIIYAFEELNRQITDLKDKVNFVIEYSDAELDEKI